MIRLVLLPLAIGALTAGCASARADSMQTPSLACSAAEAAMPSPDGKDLIFSTASPEGDSPDIVGAAPAELALGWSGREPSPTVLKKVRAAIRQTALDCPNVYAKAASQGSVLSETAGMSRLRGTPLGQGKPVYLYRISPAAVSKDGTEAVVAIAASSNQLGGGTTLISLRRSPGGWKKVGQRTLRLG